MKACLMARIERPTSGSRAPKVTFEVTSENHSTITQMFNRSVLATVCEAHGETYAEAALQLAGAVLACMPWLYPLVQWPGCVHAHYGSKPDGG